MQKEREKYLTKHEECSMKRLFSEKQLALNIVKKHTIICRLCDKRINLV